MLYVMHPTYTIRLEIQDRHDNGISRFFNGLTGKSGCDEVLAVVRAAIESAGIGNVSVLLEKFEHRA